MASTLQFGAFPNCCGAHIAYGFPKDPADGTDEMPHPDYNSLNQYYYEAYQRDTRYGPDHELTLKYKVKAEIPKTVPYDTYAQEIMRQFKARVKPVGAIFACLAHYQRRFEPFLLELGFELVADRVYNPNHRSRDPEEGNRFYMVRVNHPANWLESLKGDTTVDVEAA